MNIKCPSRHLFPDLGTRKPIGSEHMSGLFRVEEVDEQEPTGSERKSYSVTGGPICAWSTR